MEVTSFWKNNDAAVAQRPAAGCDHVLYGIVGMQDKA
jgi:hypothetical protein